MKFDAVPKWLSFAPRKQKPNPLAQAPDERASASESVIEEFVDRELTHHRSGRSHSHGPLPIIIAITGHRDLREEDTPATEGALREQYQVLQTHYPSTSFILLSALAEGADRLGARLALELGLRLIVVLPMPRDLYVTDFDEASRQEFNELLRKAEHWFELPIVEGLTREDVNHHGEHRGKQYAAVGAYLAMHSTILVALWDGVQLQLIGGTSQVVKYKTEGVPEPYAPPRSELDAPDNGPVYHIVTPRRSNPTPNGKPFSLHKIYPSGYQNNAEAEKAYRDMYDRMEMFNRDALEYAEELKHHRRASKEYLFPSKSHAAMPAMLREMVDFYSIADVLSQRFQTRTTLMQRWLLTFLFFAAMFHELYPTILDDHMLVAMYLAMFIFAYASFSWAARKSLQTRYLDYRALAEGLRVQFFWKLGGLKDSVADYYLRKQKSELDWIRHAVRSCMTETCADDPAPTSAQSAHEDATARLPFEVAADTQSPKGHLRLRQVLKHWVEDQARYFAKAAHRDHERLKKTERWVTFIFAATIVLACYELVTKNASDYVWFGVGLLPVLGAVLQTYADKMAYAEHKRQYDRMSVFYHRAQVHLKKLIDEDRTKEAQHFIAELGKEALAENGDWILTHRTRPLEVPKG